MASTSSTPRRCATCREWAKADPDGYCTRCGSPYEPEPLVGQPRGP